MMDWKNLCTLCRPEVSADFCSIRGDLIRHGSLSFGDDWRVKEQDTRRGIDVVKLVLPHVVGGLSL